MKAPVARHERRARSQSTICVICLLGVLISAMSLGSLRLYGLYLEHRLAHVTMRIETINNKNTELEERYASLLSPSRVYNYAKGELKMVTASKVETIKLDADASGFTSVAVLAGQPVYAAPPGKIARFFTGVANAKD